MGSCLAVLNKYEGKQRNVLDMIFNSLQKKSEAQENACIPGESMRKSRMGRTTGGKRL
jgi:hypothetical protein